jgi:hypothetical protein
MARIINSEAREERARNLGPLNGMRLVFVSLAPAALPTEALLDVEFYNANSLAAVVNDVQNNGVPPTAIFSIRGGTRMVGGEDPGQVQVQEVVAGATPEMLRLRVQPIGDYSTYTLAVHRGNDFDPIFSEIAFKFRPGCFNLNCAPPAGAPAARPIEPVIDYLARDYDSFKHVLINAMRDRVPGWQPTSEADLDQVLLDLIAAEADELSDFQDRIMNEAYLGRVRKRVSLARHARLMDYHLHQGNQASTWLALRVGIPDVVIPADFGVWSGRRWQNADAVIFKAEQAQRCLQSLNDLSLYSWGGVVTALEAGSTEADLALPAPLDATVEADATTLADLFRDGEFRHLLVQEHLNPETGGATGTDKSARQVVQLLEGSAAADTVFDPLGGEWLVRVRWRPEDQLRRRYCFLTACTGEPVTEGVSAFHGNLMRATHGRPYQTIFRPPGAPLAGIDSSAFVHLSEAHFETTPRWGVLCLLPEGPLAYRKTPPGGETPPRSTLEVEVAATGEEWAEQPDLIESEADDQHFIVETDELGFSRLRFGNGVNGQPWDQAEAVRCRYQVGGGSAGNVGPDALVSFDAAAFPAVAEVWNPLDVTDGRDPEKPADALRRIPEAYRARQLRAVTRQDYAARARELPEVSNAYALYGWTGSWRTVRVLIDPAGTATVMQELRARLAGYLDAVRLIGEDIEVRGAQFVSLDIKLTLCAHPDYWPEDLSAILDLEFSDGYTPDGRPGFFHVDQWTFGQPLYASQLIGRALAVQGVERVLKVSMRRWDGLTGPHTVITIIDPEDVPESLVDKIEVQPFEIIRLDNDPSHMERGRIQFEILGGRG